MPARRVLPFRLRRQSISVPVLLRVELPNEFLHVVPRDPFDRTVRLARRAVKRVASHDCLSLRPRDLLPRWYEARQQIERLFRAFASGERIEDRRVRNAAAVAECLAFDAVAAWRESGLEGDTLGAQGLSLA